MKKHLIILAFLPLFGFGQKTAGYDFLYDGDIVVVGSDTTLEGDLNYILTFVDFDITLDYLPLKSAALLNGQPLCTIFQNANYADTSFTLFAEHTLNADLTEALPNRILEIWHYATPTPDVNNYAETPFLQTASMLDVCATCTYTDILAANTAASSGDTIICFDGSYNTFDFTKSIYIKNVGNSTIDCSTNAIDFNGNSINCIIDGFDITGVTGTRLIEFQASDGLGTLEVRNSSLYNNYIMLWGSASNPIVTVNNSLLSGLSNLAFQEFFFNECYIYDNPSQTLAPVRITGGLISLSHNKIVKNHTTEYAIDIQTDGNARAFDCDVENMFYRSVANLADSLVLIDHCNIYNTDATSLLSLNGTSANVEIKNTTFTDGALILQDNTSVLIDSCTFVNPNSTITIGNTSVALPLTFSNDSITEDGNGKLSLTNVYGEISNNYMYSTSAFNIILNNLIDMSSLDFDVNGNSFNMNTSEAVSYLQLPTLITYNLLDIYDNHFKFPFAFGINNIDNHATLIFNTNAKFRFNKVEGAHNGWVSKKPANSTLINECYGNIFIECEQPLWWRDSRKSIAYNNTFYNDTIDLIYAVYIDDNGGGGNSDSCQFINNIVEANTGGYLWFTASADSVGFVSSNNVIFGATDININSITSSFATWQGLGYDLNSFNSDPLLDANLCPASKSPAVFAGLNLGSPYNIGLVCGTSFPNPTLRNQTLPFYTIGAYVVDKPINSVVRIIGGGMWIYNNSIVGY